MVKRQPCDRSNLKSRCSITVAVLMSLLMPMPRLSAQTFTLLHVFGTSTNDGALPLSSPVLGNGALFGVTSFGSPNSYSGIVYEINPDGTGYQILHTFTNSPDGRGPRESLVLNGTILYGTTEVGGFSGAGTIFEISTNGMGYTILHNFTNSPDGAEPVGLVLNSNTLYGITIDGGSNGVGTVFSINTDGMGYTILHDFTNSPDGAVPVQSLVLNSNTLYGMTYQGGSYGVGTVFMVNTDGTDFNVLYNFTNSPDGAYPAGGLVLEDGVFYGTTASGGAYGWGTLFKINTDGTGYDILHQFNVLDGELPLGRLVLNGNKLYGATDMAGPSNYGTIFQVSTNGTNFAVIQSFDFNSTGGYPNGGLALSGSTLYGTTQRGGSNGYGGGTIYSLNLEPVVQTALPTNGAFTLTWSTVSNVAYQVQYSTDLASTNWCNLGNTITATNVTTTLLDPLTNFQRFYRISIP